MRVLYTNPCRDAIVPSNVDAHRLKKGRESHNGTNIDAKYDHVTSSKTLSYGLS